MKTPITNLGYDVVVASLPTPRLAETKKVVFVAEVQTEFLEEQPTVDCA